MSSLIDSLMEYWIVDDTSLLNSDFVVSIVCLVLRLKIPRMSYMSTLFFDIRFMGMKVSYLTQPVIESGSQPYDIN